MDHRAREAVSGRIFALDPIAPDFARECAIAPNSNQRFRCYFRDCFGDNLQLFGEFI